jgi:hypothetical protein
MNKDNDYIAALYESVCLNDPFNKGLDENNIDWDKFFYKAVELSMFATLIEDCELTTKEPSCSYLIQTLDGKEFNIVIGFEENESEVSCYISLQDLNKNLLDINLSKLLSFELFTALKLSFLKSFVEKEYNLNQMTKIAFEISELKDERLLLFYKKLVSKHFPNFNQTSFEEISEKHYISLFATKI